MLPRPPSSPLFPYTTLFRSTSASKPSPRPISTTRNRTSGLATSEAGLTAVEGVAVLLAPRSEEHTSELQSHSDLVCRLLLEKKKKTISTHKRCTALLWTAVC